MAIFSSICLPSYWILPSGSTFFGLPQSQNAVIAVRASSFWATDGLSEKLKVQSWGKPHYGKCCVWKVKKGAGCVPKKRQHSGAPSGLKDNNWTMAQRLTLAVHTVVWMEEPPQTWKILKVVRASSTWSAIQGRTRLGLKTQSVSD